MRRLLGTTLAGVLAGALLLMGGCGILTGDGGGDDVDQDAQQRRLVERNDRIGQQLADGWTALPGVVEAGAQYQANVESTGVTAAVSCRGCDVDDVFDRVTGDIWRSRIADMPAFTVQVWDVRSPEDGRSRTFTVVDDGEQLTRDYGARPEGTDAAGTNGG